MKYRSCVHGSDNEASHPLPEANLYILFLVSLIYRATWCPPSTSSTSSSSSQASWSSFLSHRNETDLPTLNNKVIISRIWKWLRYKLISSAERRIWAKEEIIAVLILYYICVHIFVSFHLTFSLSIIDLKMDGKIGKKGKIMSNTEFQKEELKRAYATLVFKIFKKLNRLQIKFLMKPLEDEWIFFTPTLNILPNFPMYSIYLCKVLLQITSRVGIPIQFIHVSKTLLAYSWSWSVSFE